jgi:hypothetical protein
MWGEMKRKRENRVSFHEIEWVTGEIEFFTNLEFFFFKFFSSSTESTESQRRSYEKTRVTPELNPRDTRIRPKESRKTPRETRVRPESAELQPRDTNHSRITLKKIHSSRRESSNPWPGEVQILCLPSDLNRLMIIKACCYIYSTDGSICIISVRRRPSARDVLYPCYRLFSEEAIVQYTQKVAWGPGCLRFITNKIKRRANVFYLLKNCT